MDSMLKTLRKIVQHVAAHGDFADAMRLLVAEVKQAVETDVCSIYLLNEQRTGYTLSATDGLN
ncbi:MAG: hypothetical protein AAF993_10240, partial [Pseudomonadota bacterium]